MDGDRGFQEITVMRLGYQTQAQRFGPLSMPHAPPTDDSDSEEEEEELDDNHNAVPRIVEWRMNLTVLSQYHNLYFVVYGDQIYVYRPQGSRQVLPSKPSIILDPPQSEQSLKHSLSRYHAHIINHLVIGDLGNKEVLLCSCHDGDIIAYYTQAIENAVQSGVTDGGSIRPFFEENIGASAWGLAIHKQSRLIAVGSNNHEVQVFAFGLSKSTSKTRRTTFCRGEKPSTSLTPLPERFPALKLAELPLTETKKIARDSNFRMVFKLEPLGDNIPYVAFSDDIRGDAQSIVAKDIRGALWFFSLWTGKRKRLQPVTDEVSSRNAPLGWGIIILPRTFFKPTHNLVDTWGIIGTLIRRHTGFDISRTVLEVKDSAIWYDRHDSDEEDEDDDEEEDEDDGDGDEVEDESEDEDKEDEEEGDNSDDEVNEHMDPTAPEPDISTLLHRDDQDDLMYDSEALSPNISSTSQSTQTVQSPTILSSSPPSTLGADASFGTNSAEGPISCFATSGPTIIHTNRHSIYLLPTTDASPPTHCKNILRQEYSHDVWFPRALSDYDRLNMLASIPELSLVLAASQVGRVALLTVTRPVDRFSRTNSTVAMRLELILPFASEETVERIRPSYGLLGMAVGPMQGERERGAKTGEGPRRWRLMLHYFNHAILSYELSRSEETGEIVLF